MAQQGGFGATKPKVDLLLDSRNGNMGSPVLGAGVRTVSKTRIEDEAWCIGISRFMVLCRYCGFFCFVLVFLFLFIN